MNQQGLAKVRLDVQTVVVCDTDSFFKECSLGREKVDSERGETVIFTAHTM